MPVSPLAVTSAGSCSLEQHSLPPPLLHLALQGQAGARGSVTVGKAQLVPSLKAFPQEEGCSPDSASLGIVLGCRGGSLESQQVNFRGRLLCI